MPLFETYGILNNNAWLSSSASTSAFALSIVTGTQYSIVSNTVFTILSNWLKLSNNTGEEEEQAINGAGLLNTVFLLLY